MTQAGRQGSPRNSSGRNSSERNAGQGGASRNPAQGGSGRPSASGAGFRAGAGKRNAGFGGGDRPYKAPRPREEPFVDPGDAPESPAGRGASDWKPAASPARKPAARKPGAKKVPGTPGALKPKPRTGKPGAAASRAFGSERFGQNLGPVRKPSRKRGPRGAVPQSEMHDADGTRLQKVMAQAGVASRRVCEEMIAEGRVEVGRPGGD